MVPASGGCSPDSTRRRLLLPAPFRPMRAMRSPDSIWRSASSNRGRCPKARLTFCNDKRGKGETYHVQRAMCYVLRSEEHTSELQSQSNLVCRLLLEKKKIIEHTTSDSHQSTLC